MDRNDHPAWSLYNVWRTSILNEKYYAAKMDFLQKVNTTMDLIIAFTAPSGTISALWLWNTEVGSVLWKILLVIAAIVGILKPLLHPVDTIRKLETCLSGYRLLVHDTAELIDEMKRKQAYDAEIINGQKEVSKRVGTLITQNPETKENKRLKNKLFDEINENLKDYVFYIPEVYDV